MSSTSTICQDYKSALSSSPWPKLQTPYPFTEENQKNSSFECISSRNGESPSDPDFLHSLTNNSKHIDDSKKVYFHPMERQSNYSLSTKSLAMCTEGLGNETGCVFYSSMDAFSVLVLEKQSFPENNYPKTGKSRKKVHYSRCFPPPLSSISGKDVQLQSHREGGRLVIKALNFSCCSTYFRAVRQNGRLKLSICKDKSWDCEDLVAEEDGKEPEKHCDENDDSKLKDGGKVGCRIGGGERLSSRCKGDDGKKLHSLPFCMAIS